MPNNSTDILQFLPSAESINDVKSTVNTVNTNVNSVKTDVASVKTDVATVNNNVDNIKTMLGTNTDNVSVFDKLAEIKDSMGSSNPETLSSEEYVVALALCQLTKDSCLWALSQNNIGKILNSAFSINSSDLLQCKTVSDIINNRNALLAILSSSGAVKACLYHDEISNILHNDFSDDDKLSGGVGYIFFNVGDVVSLTYNGNATNFRVVHKDYITENSITLCSEKILEKTTYGTTNSYSTSNIRSYINSTMLSRFTQGIQNAIKITHLPCVDYSSAPVDIYCDDKIWILSPTELGGLSATNYESSGKKLLYFTGDYTDVENPVKTRRAKTTSDGKTNIYFTRSAYSNSNGYVFYVEGDGSRISSISSKDTSGVVIAFEI